MACTGSAAALAVLGMATAAQAQPIEWDGELRLTALGGDFAQSAPFENEPGVGRLSVSVSAAKLFANGLELKAVFTGVGERDHPRRDPRGGLAGDCPAANPSCPSVAGAAVRGYLSGFSPGGQPFDRPVRGALEQAYLSLRGGYGEISVGRDEGVASRFSLAPPTVLPAGDLLHPSIDPTGFSGVLTRNDVSGQSFKVTATSPRILGLRVGASWTPSLEAQGVDQGYRRGPGQPLTANPRNLAEFGASFEHTWRNGLKTKLSGSYANGGDATGLAAFDRLESWSYGAGLQRRRWSIGAQRLGGDNAWADGGRGYRATAASLVREGEHFGAMLAGGRARDDLARVTVSTATLGGAWKVAKPLELFAGVTAAERRTPQLSGNSFSPAFRRREESLGGFLGFSLRV